MEIKDHSKPHFTDKEIVADVSGVNLSRKALRRAFSVGRTFIDVSFKQSEISDCYFRNCRFIRCDFTGANINRSNFRGASFEECSFHYSTWEHTQLDEEFLDNCLPSEENLARDLVRSIRVNFGHTGNYLAVNRAASIEVALTGQHLYQAAYSRQSYYRSKYKGWSRVTHAIRHARWKALDLLWGNGESIPRILVSVIALIVIWSGILTWSNPSVSLLHSLVSVTYAFLGIDASPFLPSQELAALAAIRFAFFGLFMATVIKRLSRR